ncbi:thermostable hemolysin [Aestuariivirga sp.]|uniref:thermostable hemolysin n=1 Tax=Aestuariivirga sp. TaxID=2650926 RepID=UPI0039E67FE9
MLEAGKAAGTASSDALQVRLLTADDKDRRAAQDLIARRYEEQFGVRIVPDYPQFLTLQSGTGGLLSAVGIRRAADAPLFLEQYLDQPVEDVLAGAGLGRHPRSAIVELGSLASLSNRASLYLIAAMAAYMQQKGFAVATVTGTRRLRRIFSLFDLDLSTLAAARAERLTGPTRNWGSYYDDDPQVLAAPVAHCFEAAVLNATALNVSKRSGVLDSIVAQVKELA